MKGEVRVVGLGVGRERGSVVPVCLCHLGLMKCTSVNFTI